MRCKIIVVNSMGERALKGEIKSENNLEDASRTVKTFINANNQEALIRHLNELGQERRTKIINHPADNCSPFFLACLKGREDIVRYMLSECNPDIELRGLYELESINFKDRVTPLWVTACEQNLSLVKILVSHGADVNAASSTYSTPVRSVCYFGNLDIVKYLVANGANIHQPNVYGSTCLINACGGSVELCEFLVNNGASVNATTIHGHTALSIAIEEGRLDLVKFLLNVGVSHFVTTTSKVHILFLAAIHGNRMVFDYIKDNTVMKLSRLANGYELLGATIIDNNDDFLEGLSLWQTAMDLRYANPEAPLNKNLPNETKQAYRFHRECATPEQIRVLDASDEDKMYMHALLVRERILGMDHDETIFGIQYRGEIYAHFNHHQRGVDLCKYAYSLRRQADPASDTDLVSDLQSIIKMFKQILKKSSSGNVIEKVQANDVVDVFGMLVSQLQDFIEILKIRPLEEHIFHNFRSLLVITIDLMKLFYRSEDQTDDVDRFTDIMKTAVMLGASSEEGEQLLHLALMIQPNDTDDDVPSIGLVRCLLTAGACVNATDNGRNTSLHHCIASLRKQRNNPRRADQWKNLAWLLIENGAHVDAQNSNKEVPLDFLIEQDSISPFEYTNLKCMAAKVIVAAGISYRDYLPFSLITFVELHE